MTVGLLCIVALVVAGRFASSAHMLLVPHVRCAHGKLVHAEAAAANSAEAASVEPHEHGAELSSRAHSNPHEHCGEVAITDAAVLQDGPAVVAQVIDWQLLSPSLASASPKAAIAILMLAPKSSPPSA